LETVFVADGAGITRGEQSDIVGSKRFANARALGKDGAHPPRGGVVEKPVQFVYLLSFDLLRDGEHCGGGKTRWNCIWYDMVETIVTPCGYWCLDTAIEEERSLTGEKDVAGAIVDESTNRADGGEGAGDEENVDEVVDLSMLRDVDWVTVDALKNHSAARRDIVELSFVGFHVSGRTTVKDGTNRCCGRCDECVHCFGFVRRRRSRRRGLVRIVVGVVIRSRCV
jgi:hypothetical protein